MRCDGVFAEAETRPRAMLLSADQGWAAGHSRSVEALRWEGNLSCV